jgi:polysaccharide biosynthesis protein PslH
MKILQVSNKIPYPEKDGGAIAINAITEGLLAIGCNVTLLAMNTKKHFINAASIPEKFRNDRHLETIEADTSVKPMNAFIALLSGKSYNISRFQSEEFNRKLTEILQKDKFDIIQLEGLYLAPYLKVIRQNSKAQVILRAHNIEWKIWQKLAFEEKNILKKWYLTKLYKQLKKYEESIINKFDGIATITNLDLEYLRQIGCKAPAVNIPFGIDISKYTTKETKNSNSLFYIGALDWLPNLQGLDWFFMNIWDRVHAKFPDVQFHIAGRNMPESFHRGNYSSMVFHGEVEDAKTFMEEYDIMLVPLLTGSGVRVKIIEGMAMGKPIITTNVGVEGIECTFGQDILVANTPEEFACTIYNCLSNIVVKNSLAQNARKFVEKQYNIGNITARLMEFYKDRISQKQ